jgi:hypothetical protein
MPEPFRGAQIVAFLALAACSPSEEDLERACFEKLSADFAAARLFGREQAAASAFGSDEAVTWQAYALRAAKSDLAISLIYSDGDRNACDYVSAGADLHLK